MHPRPSSTLSSPAGHQVRRVRFLSSVASVSRMPRCGSYPHLAHEAGIPAGRTFLPSAGLPLKRYRCQFNVEIRGRKIGDTFLDRPSAFPPFFETVALLPGPIRRSARQEQGESTWDPLNASELAPNSANGLIPSLIAWAKSQPPGNVAIVSHEAAFPPDVTDREDFTRIFSEQESGRDRKKPCCPGYRAGQLRRNEPEEVTEGVLRRTPLRITSHWKSRPSWGERLCVPGTVPYLRCPR